MKERFEGSNRPRPITPIARQEPVCGKREIGEWLADRGELKEFATGENLIVQDDSDNDVFFLLTGNVSIIVNNAGKYAKGRRTSRRNGGDRALPCLVGRRSTHSSLSLR
jgi:hypothetical protein